MTSENSAPLRLDTFLADRRALSRDAFLVKHPHPVLVLSEGGDLEDQGAFRTQVITSGVERDALPVASKITVIPVSKRMADAFQNFIWAGRESRCDVVLPFDGVSKLQAQFVKRAGGGLDLLDPGSTNGTYVEGARLEKNKAVALRDGMRIRFGRVSARFRTAEGFWDETGRFL